MKYPRLSRFTRITSRYWCLSERKTHKTAIPRYRKRPDLSGCLGDTTTSRFFRLFLFSLFRFRFFLVVATLLINTSAYAQVVEIPDPNLEQAIRDQLNLEFLAVPSNEPITQFNMLRLGWLDGRGKNITDLTGLEYATNLDYLYLGGNAIENLEPLAGLTKLVHLDLYENRIQDVTPLANLINLERLYIHGNLITDITPIQGLNLIEFFYDEPPDDEVVDFPSLPPPVIVNIPDPNLEKAIRDQLNLEFLVLPPDEPITQQDLLKLGWLDGRGKNITDLTGLQYATNLDYLYLGGNAIENLEPLAGLIKLVYLDLYHNRIQDITPLANLINLEVLFIHGNLITDITPLQGLNISEFVYAEPCDIPPTLPSVRERIESRTFPSIFAWRGRIEVLGFDHLTNDERAALHDLNFGGGFMGWYETPVEPFEGIATSMGGNLPRGRASHQRQLDLNPNIVSLIEIRLHAHWVDDVYPPGSDFWLRDENGEIIRRRHGLPLINFLKPEVQDLIVKRIVAVARCGLFDGIMIDGFRYNGTGFSGRSNFPATHEEIIEAYLNIFRAVRSQVRDDFLIIANTMVDNINK